MDEVKNSIIKPEWFDAAVDAHKIERLKETFKPLGAKIAAHDPSDSGYDSKGFAASIHSLDLARMDQKGSTEKRVFMILA